MVFFVGACLFFLLLWDVMVLSLCLICTILYLFISLLPVILSLPDLSKLIHYT